MLCVNAAKKVNAEDPDHVSFDSLTNADGFPDSMLFML